MKKFIIGLSATASLLSSSLPAFCMDPPQEQETRYVPTLELPKEIEQQIINLTAFTPKFHLLPGDPEKSSDDSEMSLDDSDGSIDLSNGNVGFFFKKNTLFLRYGKRTTINDNRGYDPFELEVDRFDFIASGATLENYNQILGITQRANQPLTGISLEPEDEKALFQYTKFTGLFNLDILNLSLVCKCWKTFCDPLITSLPRMKINRFGGNFRYSLQPPNNFKNNIIARFKNITSLCCPLSRLIPPNVFPNLTYLDLSRSFSFLEYNTWNKLSQLTGLKLNTQPVDDTFVKDFPNLKNLKLNSMLSIGHSSSNKLSCLAFQGFEHLTLLDLQGIKQDHTPGNQETLILPEIASILNKSGITVLRK